MTFLFVHLSYGLSIPATLIGFNMFKDLFDDKKYNREYLPFYCMANSVMMSWPIGFMITVRNVAIIEENMSPKLFRRAVGSSLIYSTPMVYHFVQNNLF
jgi:hypothetical protein